MGKYHDLSGGLLIGGKDLKTEKNHILNTNIRLLQHMDKSPTFDCGKLVATIIIEVDRITTGLGIKNCHKYYY